MITKKLIELLKTNEALFWAALLALYPMIKHTKTVYYNAQVSENIIDAWIYAVALELAILLFVLRTSKVQSEKWDSWYQKIDWKPIFFAIVSIGINVCYYFDVPIWISKAIITIILPTTIAFYSYEVIKRQKPTGRPKGVKEAKPRKKPRTVKK